jgi:hypothetical protein
MTEKQFMETMQKHRHAKLRHLPLYAEAGESGEHGKSEDGK